MMTQRAGVRLLSLLLLLQLYVDSSNREADLHPELDGQPRRVVGNPNLKPSLTLVDHVVEYKCFVANRWIAFAADRDVLSRLRFDSSIGEFFSVRQRNRNGLARLQAHRAQSFQSTRDFVSAWRRIQLFPKLLIFY